MFDRLFSADVFKNNGFLVQTLRGNEKGHGLAHRFLSRIAKQPFRAGIPTGDDAVEVFADDGIIRRFYDSGEASADYLGLLAIGDVDVHPDPFAH